MTSSTTIILPLEQFEKDYEVELKVSEGNFGKVFRARSKPRRRSPNIFSGSLIVRQGFFKRANPGLILVHFRSFQRNNTIFTTMQCPSSIRRWDLNPRPLEHESSPITTRPGHQGSRPLVRQGFVLNFTTQIVLPSKCQSCFSKF